ncbi:MAG TPA: hypothetical protein PKW44_00015 [Methylophilaceae bacterium]|nr:hypothetical protein [Methylophilaceae bacterium]
MKISNPEYLAKVELLTADERERLLSRMAGKLPRKLERDKLSENEALAIQMALEDEQLQEWREKMHSLKAQAKGKEKADKAKKGAEKPAKAKGATGKAGEAPGKPGTKMVAKKPVVKAPVARVATKPVAKPAVKPAAKTAAKPTAKTTKAAS